jgi:cytochrome c-type biogenesis protein CcmE
MRKLVRALVIAVLAVAGVGTVVVLGIFRAARQMPPFYREALAVQPAAQKSAGQQFERNALALHNQLNRSGQWTVRFKQDEINGWLAAELPVKFPKALPAGVSQPRVAIERRRMQLALRYSQGQVETILSLTAEVFLTAELNELAVRIVGVRAGALPVPMVQLQSEVAERAARAGFPLRWGEIDGDPVALIKLAPGPEQHHHRRIVLEVLDLGDGELTITGRTEQEEQEKVGPVATQPVESETRER